MNDYWATQQIVEAVADDRSVSQKELTPIANYLDPDALNTLFSADSEIEKEFRFEYEGYVVVVEDRNGATLSESPRVRLVEQNRSSTL